MSKTPSQLIHFPILLPSNLKDSLLALFFIINFHMFIVMNSLLISARHLALELLKSLSI